MKKVILTALVLSAVMLAPSCKKKGCMDPLATNYDSEAKKEDEDEPCTYATDTTDTVPVDPTATKYTEATSTVDHDADPATAALSKISVTVKDNGKGTGTITWTKNKTYLLEGRVFVNDGQTLTIEAGTVIKGKAGVGENASALVVAQGGKIMAEGSASLPIIMTCEADLTTRYSDGTFVQSTLLDADDQGFWGGLIVLGKAGLNSTPGTTAIEGIPTTETRGIYGGTNDADNSGVIKYVSVRHGGTNIGANNEINGITLGGVGSGTTVDYIEVYGNSDDGVEFFGGTVNVKHALVYGTGDDSFDYDEGFRGKGQYWVSINPADRHGEHDGGTNPEDGLPYATPTIYNATYIGDTKKLTFRDNAGGHYINSILLVSGIDIEDLASGQDSKQRLDDGQLSIKENVITKTPAVKSSTGTDLTGHVNISGISTTDPVITAANPVPASAVSATGVTDTFLDNVSYKGAFDGSNWATGWTRTFQ